MQRGDRRLQHVGAAPAQRKRAVERRAPRLDLPAVPQRPVLLGEQHQLAAAHARRAARVVQEHQRQQPTDLRLVGHQLVQRASQADRLAGELPATVVALVEDQVDHRQHRAQTVGQQVRRRDPERDRGVLDLALGAHQPLGHRRLRHQERARDLLGRQASQRAQRERHLRIGRERRVAAGEDQLQAFVREGRLGVHLVLRSQRGLQQLGLLGERALAPDAVDRAVARRAHEPRPRIRGRALARPALGRDGERLLRGFLGAVEVAEEADQRSEDPAPLVSEELLGQYSTSGRTSIAPPSRAAGIRAASSIAASRSSASNR